MNQCSRSQRRREREVEVLRQVNRGLSGLAATTGIELVEVDLVEGADGSPYILIRCNVRPLLELAAEVGSRATPDTTDEDLIKIASDILLEAEADERPDC